MIQIGDFKTTNYMVDNVNSVLKSGRITEGKWTSSFERRFADIVENKYCIAVNSGTSALMIAIRAMSPYQDKLNILTTPISYIATSNAIINTGNIPMYVDIDLDTFNMSVELANEFIDDNCVDIVLPVHLFGFRFPVEKLNEDNVIEDAAQALGTKGIAKGDMTTFSFYVAHTVQAGEMGAVTTNDYKYYLDMKALKSNGRICRCKTCTRNITGCQIMNEHQKIDPRFTHYLIGYNFRTTDLITSIAYSQLEDIEENVKKRKDNAKFFNDELKDIDGIHVPKYDKDACLMMYPMIVEDRYKVVSKLAANGIESRYIFPCIPLQPAFAYKCSSYTARTFGDSHYYERVLPNAIKAAEQGLYIPCHQYLSEDDLHKIVNVIKEAIK